ncbi:phosphatidylserine decarboxylase [Alkalicoccobacillus porphyridii]|uniref:Phosphatidylserine decarboxylase proenzyme n=2 Tax=Alkalicoccobacillus porphyridii TaxID=2597270 RepID=A0A553ZZG8_9BACI|nr:phosphatidylserine decarboxylase [Alkalicoccobacillus porphyridii]
MRGFRWFFCSCVELSNGPFLSKRLKSFAESTYSKPFVPLFVKAFKIDLKEASLPIKQYNSLHSFFIRELKEGKREVDQEGHSVVSPVDGVLAEQGELQADSCFEVKGQRYTIVDMLGSEQAASFYKEGTYMVLYLSPSHYHRFHAPLSGTVLERWKLGNTSYPVNHLGMKYGKKPLSGNFRIISEIKSKFGTMAMVKVGAMNINTIELTHDSEVLKKGEEVGYFSFGSTIVLLFTKDMIALTHQQTPKEIKMGEKIGSVSL